MGKNNVKGEYYEFVRNPYYWKTDANGQQLPYMDKIVYTTVQNVDLWQMSSKMCLGA